MKKSDIEEILDEIGIPYEYHHFEVENAVQPPFICWLVPGTVNFSADGNVYFSAKRLDIELYTDEKKFELEEKIEDVFGKYGIYWENQRNI